MVLKATQIRPLSYKIKTIMSDFNIATNPQMSRQGTCYKHMYFNQNQLHLIIIGFD